MALEENLLLDSSLVQHCHDTDQVARNHNTSLTLTRHENGWDDVHDHVVLSSSKQICRSSSTSEKSLPLKDLEQAREQSKRAGKVSRSVRQRGNNSRSRDQQHATGSLSQAVAVCRSGSHDDASKHQTHSLSDEKAALAARERMKAHRAQNPYLGNRHFANFQAHRRTSRLHEQCLGPMQASLPPRFQQRSQVQHPRSTNVANNRPPRALPIQCPMVHYPVADNPMMGSVGQQMQATMPFLAQPTSFLNVTDPPLSTPHPMPLVQMTYPANPPNSTVHWHSVPYMTYWGPTGDPHFYDIPMVSDVGPPYIDQRLNDCASWFSSLQQISRPFAPQRGTQVMAK